MAGGYDGRGSGRGALQVVVVGGKIVLVNDRTS